MMENRLFAVNVFSFIVYETWNILSFLSNTTSPSFHIIVGIGRPMAKQVKLFAPQIPCMFDEIIRGIAKKFVTVKGNKQERSTNYLPNIASKIPRVLNAMWFVCPV